MSAPAALLVSVILVSMASSHAQAQETTVFLANDSDTDITDVAVSAAGEGYWLDVDQGTTLPPGYEFDLTFDGDEGCRFDFRATYADGNEETITDVEICQASEAGEVRVKFNMAADLLDGLN